MSVDEEICMLVDSLFDVQEDRKRNENRARSYRKRYSKPFMGEWLIDWLKKAEDRIKKQIKERLKGHPVMEWIKGIKGVDAVLVGQLMSVIGDISRFDTISKLWKFLGLHVETRCEKCGKRLFKDNIERDRWINKMVERLRRTAEKRKSSKTFNEEEARRKVEKWICKCENPVPVDVAPRKHRGELLEYNPRGRTICWKIATNLLRIGKQYNTKWYQLYKKYREYYDKRGDAKSQLHAHNRAIRKIMKIFVGCLWIVWREAEGLPTRKPYAIEKGLHVNYIDPWELTE